jgi:hypothetical protein
MYQQTRKAARLFIAMGTILSGGAHAAGFYEDAPPRDIDMCVAEVRQQANFVDAARVRHDIVATKRRAVGYTIEIDTTVYAPGTGDVIREYESVCVATGGKAPSRFQINPKP